jgi:hypothetical protein
MSPDGTHRADIVQILLHPKDNSKMEEIKKYQEFKEVEELTLRPRTLRKANDRLLSARDRDVYQTEDGQRVDRNLALYESSKLINLRKHNHSVNYDPVYEK